MTADTWRLMRHTGALWRLAAISTLQLLLYVVIVVGLITPMTMLTRLAVFARLGSGTSSPLSESDSGAQFASVVSGAVQWVGMHWIPLMLAIIAIVVCWVVSGVFDVAATAGIITQTAASREDRPAAAAAGLRDGFRIWWRTVALLALAALPALVYLLIVAVTTFVAVSLPLYQGRLPDAAALTASNGISTMLSSVISLVSIPLAVLVALGLRFAVLGDCEWRDAVGRAWRLMRVRAVDVLVMYLLIAGIGIAIAVVMSILMCLVGAVLGVIVAVVVAGGAKLLSASVVGVGGVAAVFLLVILFAATMVSVAWQSVAWTLFWRRATGAEQPVSPRPEMPGTVALTDATPGPLRGD